MRLAALALLAVASLPASAACEGSLLNSEHKRLIGPSESLCQYQGKAVLVVNTASQCGFTPQYEGLEALYKQFKEQGLVVLGFPSDQFGGQEYADDAEIASFCKVNFGVSFPMFSRSSVKGADANALFKGLIAESGQEPKWNFNKYLVGRDGKTVQAFGSNTKPDSPELAKAIAQALKP